MAVEFTMPKLGLTMTDGTIREWLVADGTMVQAGDPVLVIETDKVETEVEAREAGVLSISGIVGENYECGAVIGSLLAEGESESAEAPATPASAATTSPASASPAPAPTAPTPAADAAPVAASPAPVEVAAAAIPAAPVAPAGADVAARGEHDRILASPMARAAARDRGVDLSHIAGSGPGGRIVANDVATFVRTALPDVAPDAAASGIATTAEHGRILASPMARAAARDRGVDLSQVAGSGPGGRIVADDVAAFADRVVDAAAAAERAVPPAADPALAPAETAPATPAAPAPTTAAPSGVAATSGARMLAELLGIDLRSIPSTPGTRLTRESVAAWVREQLAGPSARSSSTDAAPESSNLAPLLQEPSQVVPLRGMRGVIAERMHASLREMAQLTLSIDVDMTAVKKERARLRKNDQVVPGYTAWVIAAASRALGDHPYVNSQIADQGVAYLPDVHIGVAVALDQGLIVPVIEHANLRDVGEMHTVVADLASRAREGKLKLHELEGGTFSVTALGMYGVDMFTPVINPPNSAILGVGRLRNDTRWSDGAPTPVTMMTLSLTWDHRAFDGAPAAEFAQCIVRYLEDPAQLT